ncbi:MAG: glycosyltransferase family 39 protein [Gammaproteobacteria bacterium]
MNIAAQPSPTGWFKDLALLTLFIALLFGAFLGTRPFSVPDEGRYSEIPREMVERADYVTPYLNGIKYFEKPPLLYWIQAASIKTFGLSEWALRLPTALIALLGCLMTYMGGRLLYDRKTGFLSGIILATSILYYAMAHSITLDMAVSVALTACLLAFIMGMQYPPGMKRRWLLSAMYIFAGFAVLTKGLIGIVFPAMIIGAWILVCHEWRSLKHMYLPSGVLLFLVIVLPWHILVQQANPEFFRFYFIEQHFERYFTMNAGRYKPDWFFIPITLIGFFPWIVFLGQAITQQIRMRTKREIFLLLWAGLILIFFSLSNSKLIPYVLPIFPPLAIITGHYLTKKNTQGIRIGFHLLPLSAIAIALAVVYLPTFGNIPHLMATQAALRHIAIVLLIGTIVTYLVYRWKSLNTALITLTISSSIFLISIILAVPHVDTRSVKPLATKIIELIKPTDQVVAYGLYYQDLPFYLQQKIIVAEWIGELEFGLRHQPEATEWMINNAIFWPKWDDKKQRIYMVISQKRFAEVVKNAPLERKFFIIQETLDDLLVTNLALPLRTITDSR